MPKVENNIFQKILNPLKGQNGKLHYVYYRKLEDGNFCTGNRENNLWDNPGNHISALIDHHKWWKKWFLWKGINREYSNTGIKAFRLLIKNKTNKHFPNLKIIISFNWVKSYIQSTDFVVSIEYFKLMNNVLQMINKYKMRFVK